MESAIREEKPKKTHPDRTFEVSLSNEQYHVIRAILPLGYSLKERKKKKRLSFSISNPTKKVHFEKTNHPSEKKENPPIKKVIAKPPPPPFDSEAKIDSILKNFKYSQEWQLSCYKKLLLMKKHPSAGPFLYPVDYLTLNLPDYPLIIKNPMDLSTIEKRLKNMFYKSQDRFEQDVDLVWNNSMIYNLKGTKIYEMTLEMKMDSEKLRDEGKKRKEGTETKIDKMIKKLENLANRHNEEYDEETNKNKKDFNEERVREYFRSKAFEKEIQATANNLIYPIYQILDEWKINLENEKLNVDLDDPELIGFLGEIYSYMRKNKKIAEERIAHHTEKENYKNNETSSYSSFITDSDISESD